PVGLGRPRPGLLGPRGRRRQRGVRLHLAGQGLIVQLRDGHLVLSATDITRHVACPHITTLDLDVAEGRLEAPPAGADAQLELIFSRGRAHEAAYLEQLRRNRPRVVEIPQEGRTLADRERLTVEAMRSGADVV